VALSPGLVLLVKRKIQSLSTPDIQTPGIPDCSEVTILADGISVK